MVEVRARCEDEGRDPATLRFSLYARDEEVRDAGQERVDRLAGFAEIGLDRIVCFPTRWSPTVEAQAAFAEDCRAAGLNLAASDSGGGALDPIDPAEPSKRRVAEPGPPDEQARPAPGRSGANRSAAPGRPRAAVSSAASARSQASSSARSR